MVHRLALVIGGVGALAVLAVALMLNGLSIVGPALADSNGAATPLASALPTASGTETIVETVVDTIYIEPPAGPEASFEARGSDDDDDHAGRARDDDDDWPGRDDDRHGPNDDDDDRHGLDDD